MSQPYKIAVAGIGGVGGYYGGLLANAYSASPDVTISFVARGNHMLAIRENGLQLNRDSGSITVHPHRITDNPEELGKLDLIIFSSKAYDLETFAASFADNITDQTVILPLLNGVDSRELLQRLFPHAKTLYGCTYLISKIVADGVVQVTGDMNQLLFGHPHMDRQDLEKIAAIFAATGVNVAVPEDIQQKVWEKFSFISPMATATTSLNSSVDVILNDTEKKAMLNELMQEIVSVSKAVGINLPADIIDINRAKLEKLPAGATSSMHNDFKNNKNTELETLTGYVVKQAQQYGIDVPAYTKQYALLKNR